MTLGASPGIVSGTSGHLAPTFRKPAGWLSHMKDFDPSEDRTYSGVGPVISSQRF
jgi:hypothetical protein